MLFYFIIFFCQLNQIGVTIAGEFNVGNNEIFRELYM